MKTAVVLLLMLGFSLTASAERNLKVRVSVDSVGAKSFTVPGGEEFDFGLALSTQMLVEMSQSKDFSAYYRASSQVGISSSGLESMSLALPPTDIFGKEVPACVINQKYMKMKMNVESFEMIGGRNIKFGYTKGDIHNPSWGIGAELKVEKARLHVALAGLVENEPGNFTAWVMANGNEQAKWKEQNISVNFKGFSASLGRYYQSDLVELVGNAAQKAIDEVASQMREKQKQGERPWRTSIRMANDDVYQIAAGSIDGVRVGDTFTVKNMRHMWQGKPCESKYEGFALGRAAEIRVIAVEDTFSIVEPITFWNDFYVGDRVEILKLVD
jgi:hypothetical protein